MKTSKSLSKLISLTIICSLILLLIGCDNISKKDSIITTSSTELEKDTDQFLNLPLLTFPETIDPNKALSSEAITIINSLNEGLLRVKTEDGMDKIVGAGAKEWSVSDDGLVWTFNLRDYNWSDGKPVTAQHFMDSIHRLLDSNNGFYYSYLAFDIKNAEKYYNKRAAKEAIGVKVINDKTLEIKLERPTPHFDKKLCLTPFQPIRLDIIPNIGENFESAIDKLVYCGPFLIKTWNKNASIILEKNLNYWDKDNVYINKINFTYDNNLSKQSESFENKEFDLCIPDNFHEDKWLSTSNDFSVNKLICPTLFFIQFNQNTGGTLGLMYNKNIRKALSLCINRDEYVNKISNKHKAAYGLIPYKILLEDKEFRELYPSNLTNEYANLKKDPSYCKDIFKAGLEELNKDSSDLSKYCLNLLIFDKNNSNSTTVEWWKSTFESNLGINIKTTVCNDINTFENLKREYSYDMTFSSYDGDYNDPLSFLKFWMTSNGFSKKYGGYSSPNFDKLFSKLSSENDVSKRGKIYSDLESFLICDDTAIAPYLFKETNVFYHNYVKDVFYPCFGPKFEFKWCYTSGRK